MLRYETVNRTKIANILLTMCAILILSHWFEYPSCHSLMAFHLTNDVFSEICDLILIPCTHRERAV